MGAGPVPKSRADRRHARRLPAPPSGRRDSNPRPSPWQGDALPAALRPRAPGPRPNQGARQPGAFRTVADPARAANSHRPPGRPRRGQDTTPPGGFAPLASCPCLAALASDSVAVWMNGDLLPDDEARISIFDHGLVVGDGVFETIKVVAGQPFALSRHLARLGRSAAGLGLPEPDLRADPGGRPGCRSKHHRADAAGPDAHHRDRWYCSLGIGTRIFRAHSHRRARRAASRLQPQWTSSWCHGRETSMAPWRA